MNEMLCETSCSNIETCCWKISKYRHYDHKCSYQRWNVHTCNNSLLCNVAIIHRAQGNSWTTDNFWSTVLYVWRL